MAGRNARAQYHRKESPSRFQHGRHERQTKPAAMEYYYAIVCTVSVLSFLLYWNTLGADFAYDDSRAIKTNQDLMPSTPILQLFTNDFWGTPLTHSGSHKSYRPLCVLSFRLNYLLGGTEPWGYHFLNVVLHCVVSGLFTHFASMVFGGYPLPTLAAGLLFACHPIHTEAVAGIVGRADVGACLFFLLSLISYMRYCKYRDKKLYLALSLLFAGVSMLTKEHGVTVLMVCAAYDMFVVHKVHPRELFIVFFSKKYSSLRHGLLNVIFAAVTLLVLRLILMGVKPPDFAPADNPASDSDSFLTRTLTFLYLPVFNFWLLLCPRWLSFDWSMEAIPLLTSFSDPRNLTSLCFYVGLLCLTQHLTKTLKNNNQTDSPHQCYNRGYSRHNRHNGKMNNNNNNNNNSYSSGHRWSNSHCNNSSMASCSECHHICLTDPVVMALGLMVFPFIPATNLFFYVGFVVAERVLYIPSMGFCLMMAAGLDYLYRKQDVLLRKRAILSLFVVVLAILSMRTVQRNQDWWDEENLYRSGIPINPPKAYGNLANILSSQNKKAEAEWAYKEALAYRSNMADVHYNLGILQQEQSRFEEALQSYKLAIKFRPRLAMAHLNLGLVLGSLGKKEEAADVYRHCAQLDSSGLKDPKMHETTKISALFNLGRLYANDGSYEEAIQVYQEAVHKMPDHYQPQSLYNMMGEAFFKLQKFQEAEKWYQEALKAKPDHIPAHLTYAKLLSKWKRTSEAEKWFLKAQNIAPNDSSVYQHYGQFLSESERHAEAADIYMRAAHLAPDEYEIIFNAANAHRQAARNEDAEKFYLEAVKLRPNEVTSHMNLGAMYHVNGKLQDAENSYLEALRLKPDDVITQNNLQKLRNLIAQKKNGKR